MLQNEKEYVPNEKGICGILQEPLTQGEGPQGSLKSTFFWKDSNWNGKYGIFTEAKKNHRNIQMLPCKLGLGRVIILIVFP